MHRYGHGVLRSPDPRYIALQEFVDTEPALQKSPIVQLVRKVRYVCLSFQGRSSKRWQTFEVAPGVLLEHGKVRPNRCRSTIVEHLRHLD